MMPATIHFEGSPLVSNIEDDRPYPDNVSCAMLKIAQAAKPGSPVPIEEVCDMINVLVMCNNVTGDPDDVRDFLKSLNIWPDEQLNDDRKNLAYALWFTSLVMGSESDRTPRQ